MRRPGACVTHRRVAEPAEEHPKSVAFILILPRFDQLLSNPGPDLPYLVRDQSSPGRDLT